MKYTMPVVIFAGGKSSRMGQDKALLPFGDTPSLAQYQYERLKNCFASCYISTKHPKFDFDAMLISDRYKESSPLVGLVSAFETLSTDHLFVLSVDAPLIEKSIITSIMHCHTEHDGAYDAVIASNFGKVQPLCGIYSRTILPLAQHERQKGYHKMTALLQQAHTLYVPFEEEQAFINLNHPDEYREALRLISS